MKKVLFYASVFALAMTSCSENELDYQSQKLDSRGINFSAVVEQGAPATRGEFTYDDATNLYHYFWYAEQDRIDIYSDNVKKGFSVPTEITTWDAANAAAYKATKSESNGQFTATEDANILNFRDDKETKFMAVYPAELPTTNAANVFTVKVGGIDLTAQSQDNLTGAGVDKMIPMYSYSTAKKSNSYDAVGEKVQLSFNRLTSAVVFSTNAYDEDFGPLQKVTLASKGTTKENGGIVDKSQLNYGTNASIKITIPTTDTETVKAEFTNDAASAANELVLSLTSSENWSDDARAYMAIAPINRKAFKDANEKERMLVAYEFKNINLVDTMDTNANWPAIEGNFVNAKPLDISKYPYLVLKGATLGEYTLIVNKGTLAQVFNEDKTEVVWAAGNVDVTAFTKVKIYPSLAEADLKLMPANFENLTEVILYGQTSIPEGLFKNYGKLEKVQLDATTTIGKDAFNAAYAAGSGDNTISAKAVTAIDATAFDGTVLNNVLMPSYLYKEDAKDDLLVAANLVNLDMSAVKVMGNVFPEAGFTLINYDALKTVKVGNDLQLGSSSFQGCDILETISGGSVVLRGSSVFEDCPKLANVCNPDDFVADATKSGRFYVKTNESNGNIPASSFKNCKELKYVYDAGLVNSYLQPVTVGSSAFEGCAKLINIPLKKATTIGAKAFMGCEELLCKDDYTVEGITKKVLWVVAEDIKTEAFSGCKKLVYVYFQNAKTVEDKILYGTTALREVKFDKAFTSGTVKASNDTFGTATNIILYVAADQVGVDGKKLSIKDGVANNSITFASIEQ